MSGQGSSGRAFTAEQKAAVIRVRKCSPTAFYDILGLETTRTTCTDGEIKKAYRKLSLLTHPDKNGYDGADEAFKMISRAFQILSDADKKTAYDKYGIDSDTRGGGGDSGGGGGFASGFARPGGFGGGGMRGRGGGHMFEEEINPEDIFRQFFGGGGMGGGPFGGPFGGMFDTGPNFVFNMGGGPGVRVHQFGGNRPRRRPAGAAGQPDQQAQPSPLGTLQAMLPLLLLILLPLMSGLLDTLFSGPSGPNIRWDPVPPQTQHRSSSRFHIPYYVNPKDVANYNDGQWRALDATAETRYITSLRNTCEDRAEQKRTMLRNARGLFWTDENLVRAAEQVDLSSCRRLEDWGIRQRRD